MEINRCSIPAQNLSFVECRLFSENAIISSSRIKARAKLSALCDVSENYKARNAYMTKFLRRFPHDALRMIRKIFCVVYELLILYCI